MAQEDVCYLLKSINLLLNSKLNIYLILVNVFISYLKRITFYKILCYF